jgi:hypothetical protein
MNTASDAAASGALTYFNIALSSRWIADAASLNG